MSYEFFQFINKIKEYSRYYDQVDVNEYRESYYEDYPCSNKEDLMRNYQYCINNKFLLNNRNALLERIMSVDDLSRNHDKKIFINNQIIHVETTSGTTGKPLPILKTDNIRLKEGRYLMRCRRHIRSDVSYKNGFLFIHNSDEKILNLDLRNDKNKFKDYDKALEYFWQKDPKWAFSTLLIAKRFFDYIDINVGFDIFQKKSNIDFFETTSQSFACEEKRFFEKKLNIKLVNNYGCREVWNIAYECPCGKLHINQEYLIVSVVDENNKVIDKDGVTGKIIITSLINDVFPIVKYFIGDYGKIYKKHNCRCGINTPILVLENGRTFEKIKYTELYGNDIFKRVLRGMYFHERIRDYDDVKIVQEDRLFKVFVKGKASDLFKKEFIHITEFLLKSKEFKFDFIEVDNFEFLNMISMDKEFLFKNVGEPIKNEII